MSKSTVVTIFVLLGVFLLVGAYTYYTYSSARLNEVDSEASKTLDAGKSSPYTNMEGEPFSFDEYRGSIRVVNSWASWCPFCTKELSEFEKLGEEFKDKNVSIIAINRKEPRERANAYIKSLGDFKYIDFAVDLTDTYYKSIGGFAMPETVFYNTEGTIVYHKKGVMNLEQMRAKLNELLKE